MKKMILNFFNSYKERYDKITNYVFLAILVACLITLIVPIFNYVVAFFVCMLFPIGILNFIIMQVEFYKFFTELSKEMEKMMTL